MNHISWLIYFADLSGGASVACGIIGTLASILLLVLVLVWMFAYTDHPFSEGNLAQVIALRRRAGWSAVLVLPLALLLVSASVALPTKQTVWMIAASEAAEQVSKTDAARELTGELRDTIKALLKKARD